MEFFDILPAGRGRSAGAIDWSKAKADIMENPGLWGLIAENVGSSTAGQLNAGKNKSFQGDELKHFEFSVRRPEKADPAVYTDRRTDLYGRYTLEPREDA